MIRRRSSVIACGRRAMAPIQAILGKTDSTSTNNRYTIVGVMPARFRFTWDQEMGVFVPLALTPEELSEKGRATSRDLETQARLQPNVSVKQAQAAMDTLAANLAAEHPDANQGWGFKVEPLARRVLPPYRTTAADHVRSGPVCIADRMRQCCQPAVGARDSEKARDCYSGGDWGHAATADHPVTHRKRGSGCDWRGAGAASRIYRRPDLDTGDGALSPVQRAECQCRSIWTGGFCSLPRA